MPEDRLDPVFSALADPTRRGLVRSLAARDSATATALAADLPMSRQAVAKHLGHLGRAGLVASVRAGRETRYRLTPRPLDEAASWMTAVGAEWDRRLGALREHVAAGRGGTPAPSPGLGPRR